MACVKVQILEDESITTDERLEELENLLRHNNLDEMQNAIRYKMAKLDEWEESMKRTRQLHVKTNEKLDRIESVLGGIMKKDTQRDELIKNTQRNIQTLEDEITAIERKLQELTSKTVTFDRAGPQASPSRNTTGKALPPLVTPTPPTNPRRPTGLPEYRRNHIGANKLPYAMDDGGSDATTQRSEEFPGSSSSYKERPPEFPTGIHVGNKFIWKFTEFEECLQKAKNGTRMYYLSEPFHTGPYGYKMCIELHPNGLNDGCNTHLSVFVCLLKSEYDDILPWPFNSKVIITLIDQQPILYSRRNIQMSSLPRNNGHLSGCYSKPVENKPRNMAFGFCKFITHERLKTRRYLVNDTLFLCVEGDRLISIL